MKHLLFVLGLFCALCVSAQKGAPEGIIKDIRAQYAEAQAMAQQQLTTDDWNQQSFTSATVHYMLPGCGPTTETIHYFYLLDDDVDEEGEWTPKSNELYFVTRKYNIAARQFYEEYLFDRSTQHPLFVFYTYDTYDSDVKAEERYYFHDGQVVWQTVNGQAEPNEQAMLHQCDCLLTAFKLQVNHSF